MRLGSDWSASARLSVRLLMGALLLAVLAYRLYRRRPALQVPATPDEIAAYKRTGRFARSPGYSFYSIDYGDRLDPLIVPALTCAGLAVWAAAVCATLAPIWPPTGLRAMASAGFTLIAAYAATLASLLVYERGAGRLRRGQRLLVALALPIQAQVLDLGGCRGFLGIGAAQLDESTQVTILTAAGPAAMAATRVNARRAGVALRITLLDSAAALGNSRFDVVLYTEWPPALAPAATTRWLRSGATLGVCQTRSSPSLDLTDHTIVQLHPRLPERLLRLLSAGRVQPWAGIAKAVPHPDESA